MRADSGFYAHALVVVCREMDVRFFQGESEAAPVRLIVRRVKPTPGSQLALFASYSYHGFITEDYPTAP